jgi:hypothetical protein
MVPCRHCGAKAGQRCGRPGEYRGGWIDFHAIRDIDALAVGHYDHAGKKQCGPNSDTDRARLIINRFKGQYGKHHR